MADGVSLFYTTPQADDTQLPAPMRAPFPICTSIPFSTVGTFDSTAAPVRNPFPFLPQAKYARVRPHRHSDRPQLGKCGATLLLPRKSVGRGMGARPVVRRRDRLRRRFRRAGKVRDPCTEPGAPKYVYFLNLPTLSSRRAVNPAPTSHGENAPTATCAAYPASPQMHPQRPLQARRYSCFRRSSVR